MWFMFLNINNTTVEGNNFQGKTSQRNTRPKLPPLLIKPLMACTFNYNNFSKLVKIFMACPLLNYKLLL